MDATLEDKRQPLDYDQVKNIIRDFRDVNNINSDSSLSDYLLIRTIDGAIFRRCHNAYDILYKKRLVTNSYALYCSPFQQRLFSSATHWHIDGTFYVVPSMFYQLLVIVVYDEITDLYIPACFCLSSNKNKYIYRKIFMDIKESILCNTVNMERVTLDFELAEKEAMQEVFPDAELIGCKFHLMQAIMRKAKRKGLANDNLIKETNNILYGICDVLENGSETFENLLDRLEQLYIPQVDGQDKSETQIIDEKYRAFIVYIRNTWLPRYQDGMINYALKAPDEWTNNALESYHRRLQARLTKNPSIKQFVLELQKEEKMFSDKYFEAIRYNITSKKEPTSKKKSKLRPRTPLRSTTTIVDSESCHMHGIKTTEILQSKPVELPLSLELKKTSDSRFDQPSSPRNIRPSSSTRTLINSNLTRSAQHHVIQWIVWKNHSCRIDAFATVSYFIFLFDFGRAIFPQLQGPQLPDELHPVGELLTNIHDATTCKILQKAIDNYAHYRAHSKKEKLGKDGPISTLFMEFKGMPQFTWNYSINLECPTCKQTSICWAYNC